MNTMTAPSLATLIRQTAGRFAEVGMETPELEARLLAQHVWGCNHAGLILRMEEAPEPDAAARFAGLARRRLAREPLAYITGERAFWGLDFHVTPDVLIPRPETEFLLEQALAGSGNVTEALDLGTGSGVIAVILARELGCRVTAVDCSAAALAVARANAKRHGAAERIRFLHGDFFDVLPEEARFDLVVGNPPYVAEGEAVELAPEVLDHEPRLALFAGADGLDCVAAISRRAGDRLRPGGRIFLEIGAGQAEAASALFRRAGQYDEVRVTPDWSGRPRVLSARRVA